MIDQAIIASGQPISYGIVTLSTPTSPMFEYKVLKNLTSDILVSKYLQPATDSNVVCVIKIENSRLEIFSASSIDTNRMSISCEVTNWMYHLEINAVPKNNKTQTSFSIELSAYDINYDQVKNDPNAPLHHLS
jgi:hypothetical protein